MITGYIFLSRQQVRKNVWCNGLQGRVVFEILQVRLCIILKPFDSDTPLHNTHHLHYICSLYLTV